MAIGAGISRVARSWVIDGCLLGAGGGLAGILVSVLVQRSLPSLLPADFPRMEDVRIDAPVVLFAVVLAAVSGIVTGLVPVFQLRRTSLVESLTGHGGSNGGTTRTRGARLRGLLMGAQVAIACALLAALALGWSRGAAVGRSRLIARPHGAFPAAFVYARRRPPDAVRERLTAVPGVTGRVRQRPAVRDDRRLAALPVAHRTRRPSRSPR